MLIIAGRIRVDERDRDAYVADCRRVVEQARRAPGCLDFGITADPLVPDRVNIYERWASDDALARFRGAGPGDDLGSRIREADVHRYRIASVEDP
ncbi:putative quinol monooxygenase [Prauserella muralis]|uniref:Antibiotic biosynthesis monooxygenase n=1 Tax=Prauserella muralis TaxID=588067 RepID=A0A2V4BCZ7_9PSEU|nr:antibiotic biosynthesis monooxygenase family protein [Prauserella muralis]PXY32382.1 antibiotic biosynthesis monooxygenase [Prauserella muralis]TWE23932.1 antibiotic biosynthesis monooxygenase [Prauserella muralis]